MLIFTYMKRKFLNTLCAGELFLNCNLQKFTKNLRFSIDFLVFQLKGSKVKKATLFSVLMLGIKKSFN